MDIINTDYSKAYDLYEKDMLIISIITDDDFISVSEFAQLLNTILNSNFLKGRYINKILTKSGIIEKKTKETIRFQQDLGLKVNKYTANVKFKNLYKEVPYSSGKFYIWNAKLLFSLLGIDFRENIDRNVAQNFCKTLKKCTGQTFNPDIVQKNLRYLQIIFCQYIFL